MAKWVEHGKYEGEMIVTWDGKDWENARAIAANFLKSKGKEVTNDEVAQLAINDRLDDLFKEGCEELGLFPATPPDVDLRALTENGVTVSFAFAVRPEVKVGDYTKLRYKVEEVNVTDADVEEGIRVYLESKKRVMEEGQEPVIPELTDSFAKGQYIDGVKSVEDFRAYIRRTLARGQRLHNQQEAEAKLFDSLIAITEAEVPSRMVDAEIGIMAQQLSGALASQGMQFEDYLKAKGQTEEELIAELRPEAEKNVKTSLALEEIARQQNLFPKNEDIENEYRAMAIRYEEKIDTVKQSVPVEQLSYTILLQNAVDFLKMQK